MPRLPTITAKVLIRFLNNLGFKQVRQRGSHRFFKHSDGRTATVPDHRGEQLGRGITNRILKDIEVTREQFISWHLKQ